MKGMKRIVSLFLALVLSMSMMTISSFADEESTGINLKVTASTEETLQAGDELTAVVTVPAPAEQFAACTVQMDFNKDILEAEDINLTGITATSVTELGDANETGFVTAAYAGASDITQTEDIILTAKFKIREGVYEDSYKDLIKVNTEETSFTNADDEDLTVVFDEENLSYDADIAGLYKVKIPEGAPFLDMTSDVEGAKIIITEIDIQKEDKYQDYNLEPIYRVLVPEGVSKVFVKFPKNDVYYNESAAVTYGYNWYQYWDEDDEQYYPKRGLANLSTTADDDYAYVAIGTFFKEESMYAPNAWTSAHHIGGPEAPNTDPICGFTFDTLCEHANSTKTDAVEATCTEDGNIAYWYCDDCKLYFSDEEMTERITLDDTVVEAKGHDWGEDGVCTRCELRGDTTVNFIGSAADRVTDKSPDTENSGLDYKFKADNSKVSFVNKMERLTALDIDLSPKPVIANYFGQVKAYRLDDITYNDVSVPNYSIHTANFVPVIQGNDYDVVDADGTKLEKMYNSIFLNYTIKQNGQYYITKADSGDPVMGILVYLDNNDEVSYEPMEPDDEGLYTIPAAKMIPEKTVTISVEKTADEIVIALIDAIGEVTLEKEAAIQEAREAYDALSDEEKAKVPSKAKLRLENAEKELALLKAKTDDNAAIIDEMIDSMKQTEDLINNLNDQIDELKETGAIDSSRIDDLEDYVAELEGQLEELQGTVDALSEDAATKKELQEKIGELNQTISELNTKIAEMQTAAGTSSALDEKKATAAETINNYLEDNKANILPEDLLEAEVAALRSIIKANAAKDEEAVNAAIGEAKDAIDAKVQIKTDTEAAKALKVTGLKAKAKSKKFTVSWKKNAEAEAYQVQYKLSSAKKFSNLKKSVTKTSVKSKKLKKGKKYIFQVRTIKTVNGKKVYGAWVKTKAIKCK